MPGGTKQSARILGSSFYSFLLDVRRCIHVLITAGEVVHARFPNVRLQKGGSVVAGFATKDFCHRTVFC